MSDKTLPRHPAEPSTHQDLLSRIATLEARVRELEAERDQLQDQTEARIREQTAALRESEERFRRALEIETVGVIFFNAHGDITWANDAFLRTGGYTQEDVAGQRLRWDRLTPPEWMPASRRAIAQLKTTGSTTPYEKEYYRKDGSRWWGLFAAKGLSENDGVEFILDITEHKRAEAERERLLRDAESARAEAETANRAKVDFLGAMSHELRTPLNAVGGYVDLLDLGVHGPVTEAQRAALSRITANQRHLLMLINDILAYAKLDAGQVPFDLRRLAAGDVLGSVEPLIAPQATAKGIAYSAQPCDPALGLIGDQERVRQILLNLVTNGIKFTSAGGWVLLSCDADTAWLYIRVRDNGPGIALEKQRAIFDPFIQVDRRADQPQEGVGLGLAISRDLARGMGGDLSVESAPGAGSAFTLCLPRAEDEPRASG